MSLGELTMFSITPMSFNLGGDSPLSSKRLVTLRTTLCLSRVRKKQQWTTT